MLYNNEKNVKKQAPAAKKLFLCPNPLHGAELWGVESLQSPTLTGPPARGSSNGIKICITTATNR